MADPVKTVEEFKEKMDGVLSHADSVEEAKKKLKENNAMEDLKNIHSLSMAMISEDVPEFDEKEIQLMESMKQYISKVHPELLYVPDTIARFHVRRVGPPPSFEQVLYPWFCRMMGWSAPVTTLYLK